MFNRGVDELLQALPALPGLSAEQVRRLLTQAWLDASDLRSMTTEEPEQAQRPNHLRRLATALEVNAVIPLNVGISTVRACAFVAAEALTIASERAPLAAQEQRPWLFGSMWRFEQIEAGLLYLIAGYDSNAALVVRRLEQTEPEAIDIETPVARWALGIICALLTFKGPLDQQAPQLPGNAPLRSVVRHEIWVRIGTYVADHVRWLRFESRVNPRSGAALRALADRLEQSSLEPRFTSTQHADLHHLALLLAAACDATATRALRQVPSPDGDGGRFAAYQQQRARERPLLWPAALDYANAALPGPQAHAIVAVPTGAGKSSVAELATAQALHRGWVLYLAPTNALVSQIRRHIATALGRDAVKGYIGGAEYTNLVGESLFEIEDRQVLVMTPEKCSLALRQNPDAFSRLSLCILDEAHILGDGNQRAAITELVLAEILHRASHVRLLMLSALVANPQELADWLRAATGTRAVVIDEPWRPTRTLRAIAGVDRDRLGDLQAAALKSLDQMGPSRKKKKFMVPLALLAGLQGTWSSRDAEDYNLLPTDIEIPVKVNRDNRQVDSDGYVNPTCEAIVQYLGDRGDRVLAFLPKSKHYSFMIATRMAGFSPQPYDFGATVEALLTLAEAELGVETALRHTLSKRVAVHTSALLNEEQRASEVAFDQEAAVAMFATGTMAQGLNLPATAVVIGGTDIGFDNQASAEEAKQKARTQLLNAIGRAGRAHVAARSMAIVVPSKAVYLNRNSTALQIIRSADFLKEEDASSTITSSLDALIAAAVQGAMPTAMLGDAEQAAFSFLSFAAEGGDSPAVLRKAWAVHRAQAILSASQIADDLDQHGRTALQNAGAPSWVALAAHQAGMELPAAISLYRLLIRHLADELEPSSITAWAKLMVNLLRALPLSVLERIMPKRAFGDASRLSEIYDPASDDPYAGWRSFELALAAWMAGKPLIEVAEHIHKETVDRNAGRAVSDPLPRAIVVVNEGFGFRLSLIAGAVAALVSTGREESSSEEWLVSDESLRHLMLLPVAVRLGASSPVELAWMRAGVQPRVVAHKLSRMYPPPGFQTGDQLRRSAQRSYTELLEGTSTTELGPELVRLVEALSAVRDLR